MTVYHCTTPAQTQLNCLPNKLFKYKWGTRARPRVYAGVCEDVELERLGEG